VIEIRERHSNRVARLGRLENPLDHPGAVDDSRARLKPELPEVGDHGTPLRDELVLDKELR
jgi:hypothetical protein